MRGQRLSEVCSENPPSAPGSRSGSRCENSVTQALEQLDRPARDPLGVATVVVVGARVAVRRALGQEVVDGAEHRVRDGDHRFVVPTMSHDASVTSPQGGVLSKGMCEDVLGQRELADDARFRTNTARVAHREELIALLRETFARDTREAWLEKFQVAGLPGGAVRTMSEALTSEEAKARDTVMAVPHPTAGAVRLLRSPFRFSETPVVPPVAPPLLGEHTDEVLATLGYDATVIADLRSRKIIR